MAVNLAPMSGLYRLERFDMITVGSSIFLEIVFFQTEVLSVKNVGSCRFALHAPLKEKEKEEVVTSVISDRLLVNAFTMCDIGLPCHVTTREIRKRVDH